MVYNESMLLDVPVFTTNVISAKELVGDYGFVCNNSEEAIYDNLKKVLDEPKLIRDKKEQLKNFNYNNDLVVKKLLSLM